MRNATQQRRVDRETQKVSPRSRGRPKRRDDEREHFMKCFKKCKHARGKSSRLCGDMSMIQYHLKSMETGRKHPKKCVVCGEDAHSVCTICGKALHLLPQRGPNQGKTCFIEYHSESFFGLAKDDVDVMKIKKKDWEYPSEAKKRSQCTAYINMKPDLEVEE